MKVFLFFLEEKWDRQTDVMSTRTPVNYWYEKGQNFYPEKARVIKKKIQNR